MCLIYLLSIIVGLKDVADSPAAAGLLRVQQEPQQPLIVLMRRTLEHTLEGELDERRGEVRGRDIKIDDTQIEMRQGEVRGRDIKIDETQIEMRQGEW